MADKFIDDFSLFLVRDGIASSHELVELHALFQASSHQFFTQFLVDEGLLSKKKVLQFLSEYYKVPSFDVEGYFFDSNLLHLFPQDFLVRNLVIPLEIDENMLIVVAGEIVPGLASSMEQFVAYDIRFRIGLAQDIQEAIDEYYDTALTEDYEEEAKIDDAGREHSSQEIIDHAIADQEQLKEVETDEDDVFNA
ncbi:MAG: hypothetical protein WBQ73_04180 [Candidatus Babeliales bacterium]